MCSACVRAGLRINRESGLATVRRLHSLAVKVPNDSLAVGDVLALWDQFSGQEMSAISYTFSN